MSDEQPRTYFYGYYISFDVTGVEPVDHVLKAVADAGRGSHHTEDWRELGLEEEIQRAAHEAAAVFQARDAEVQALREALIEIRDGLEWVYMDRRAEDSFLRALRQAGRALRQVDAALAGEGGVSE